ncbi:MAG: ferrous iron transporter B [Betaproteobacteria bacterium]|nr:ferrous iron transporter B [Betaproteobacteria bacterium]
MNTVRVPIRTPLFRGKRGLRIALVGLPNAGKSSLFRAVASASVQTGELAGTHRVYDECAVQIGLDEARVLDLPSMHSLRHLDDDDRVSLKYLLWGDARPAVSAHEPGGPPAPFSPPDAIIQVIDATALERHLELTLELLLLGRPIVIALNKADEAQDRGIYINNKVLSEKLGVPVVRTVAVMGYGIAELFAATANCVRDGVPAPAEPASKHIEERLRPVVTAFDGVEIRDAFRLPPQFLAVQLAGGDRYFLDELRQHFPDRLPAVRTLLEQAGGGLPRSLAEELHADRHHRAALLFEAATRLGTPHDTRDWRYWLDELLLSPRWGLAGSIAVFAIVLFVVFYVSSRLDALTAARLVDWVTPWQPATLPGVVGRAVADGLIGLVGIVVPYMLPLVMLLVALEHAGVMARIAFAVDRGFHHLGLHGGVAVPFLLGLGCNVPAISAIGAGSRGSERVVATLLVTFVPCSARSAIILALGGKYLGGMGVFAIFALTMVVFAVLGKLLRRRYRRTGPGQVQEIPAYALPRWRALVGETWLRTRDVLTLVTPLLVGGSVVLALLHHVGADGAINTLFTPVTSWWLGLPAVLGVPILFGVLRKELSLLMIYQALGGFDVGNYLDDVQIITFLLFLTFYVPCISTFAVMVKTIGRREAFFSVSLSVGVALVVSGILRFVLEAFRYVAV